MATVAGLFMLNGCAENNLDYYKNTMPRADIKEYFNGPVKAWGIVQDWKGRVVRRFDVNMVGKWDGDIGTLTENFDYYDNNDQIDLMEGREFQQDQLQKNQKKKKNLNHINLDQYAYSPSNPSIFQNNSFNIQIDLNNSKLIIKYLIDNNDNNGIKEEGVEDLILDLNYYPEEIMEIKICNQM